MTRFPFNFRPAKRGFTLIELLIVIAIILILIAIALPNFLEAQIRAKVTKAKGELRTLAIALDSYGIDHYSNQPDARGNNMTYPPSPIAQAYGDPSAIAETWRVTTPISYIKIVPTDEFVPPPGSDVMGGPFGIDSIYLHYINDKLLGEVWVTFSFGPDTDREEDQTKYNPTNGTKSSGDIYQVGSPQHSP
jgi:prepilin-type N-terminal cleavage/methylation domain-containing protein